MQKNREGGFLDRILGRSPKVFSPKQAPNLGLNPSRARRRLWSYFWVHKIEGEGVPDRIPEHSLTRLGKRAKKITRLEKVLLLSLIHI